MSIFHQFLVPQPMFVDQEIYFIKGNGFQWITQIDSGFKFQNTFWKKMNFNVNWILTKNFNLQGQEMHLASSSPPLLLVPFFWVLKGFYRKDCTSLIKTFLILAHTFKSLVTFRLWAWQVTNYSIPRA